MRPPSNKRRPITFSRSRPAKAGPHAVSLRTSLKFSQRATWSLPFTGGKTSMSFDPAPFDMMVSSSHLIQDVGPTTCRSEEHTSELQSLRHLVCRLLLEKK